MNTWKVILATLVIFGAGVMTGGLLVGYSDRSWGRPPHQPPSVDAQHGTLGTPNAGPAHETRLPPPPNAPLRKDFVERLNRELKLNPEQHERIEKIVSEGQERTRELWREEWSGTRQKIRNELTPEQQTRFEQLFKSRPRDQRRPASPADRLSTNPPPAAAHP